MEDRWLGFLEGHIDVGFELRNVRRPDGFVDGLFDGWKDGFLDGNFVELRVG